MPPALWQAELPLGDVMPLGQDERSRAIALGDRIVPYILRRSRRRTIALSIDQRGLRVGAPPRATLAEIEALILRHGNWVTEKLDEWRSRRRPEPIAIGDGTTLPLLGAHLTVRLGAGNNRARWTILPEPGQQGGELTLQLRADGDAGRVLEKGLREMALPLFAARLRHYAALIGETLPPLQLSNARTRWGSCSAKSGIRLNWRLIHFPLSVVDYVAVHELAHLREMNHSPRFWAIVERLCPDFRAQRQTLKDLAARCPQWR